MSYYKELKILGFRGFSQECKIEFAIPNQKEGSGLTILVGENNGGRTSILETLRMLVIAKKNSNAISISEGRRNRQNSNYVKIVLITEEEKEIILSTDGDTPNAILKIDNNIQLKIYSLKSKREMNTFDYTSNNPLNREQINEYSLNRDSHSNREGENFWLRLKDIEKTNKKEEYSQLINEIIGKKLKWVLEVNDAGQNYIK